MSVVKDNSELSFIICEEKMSYKILWYSLPSLHDNSNGAAIHNKVMLEALAARGFQVKALNALVADDPQGLNVFDRIAKQVNVQPDANYIQFTDTGVEYIVARTKGHVSNDVTAEDQGKVFDLFVQFLEKFNPDVLIGYSGDCFSALVRHEAKARGIPVVYALCNGLHRSFAFPDCDLVFTPSEATANMYREVDGIDVKAVGQFIYKERVTVPNRDVAKAKYVTLVNPTPEKGLAIFAKIAEVFARKHPEQKFLVVKSVGDYYKIFNHMHNDDGSRFLPAGMVNLPNIDVAEHTDDIRLVYDVTKVLVTPSVWHEAWGCDGSRFLPAGMVNLPNIDVAEHTDDIRLVYDVTKVLVTPSVWHEAWGCVATEATFNGIPVLSSKSGGLPEAVGEGGILLEAPEKTLKDFYRVPTDEEIAPWVEALERLLSEDWSEQCKKASERNDLNRSIDRLLEYLNPIMEKGSAPWVEALERLLSEDWSEQCKKASERNDLNRSIDRLLEYLNPIMEKGSKEKAPLERSFFFSAETMKKRKAYYIAEAKKNGVELETNTQEEPKAQEPANDAPKKAAAKKTTAAKTTKAKADSTSETKAPAKKASTAKKTVAKKPAAKKTASAADKK